jgi:hypothetical protein
MKCWLSLQREFDGWVIKGAARRAAPLIARFCVRTAHAKSSYRIHVTTAS